MTVRLLPALFAFVAIACAPPSFHTEVKGQTTIPGDPTPLGALLDAFPAVSSFTNIDFSQDQEFKNRGVTKDQVRSVKVDAVTLRIDSPADQDFSFLDSLQFFARAGDQEVMVAEMANIASLGLKAPNPTLTFAVSGAELQPLVTAPSMNLVVRGKGRKPKSDTAVTATVGLEVELNLP